MRFSFAYLFFFMLSLSIHYTLLAQELQEANLKKPVFKQPDGGKRGDNELRIMFYNVENLLDPAEDSTRSDDEYQPTGIRGWTSSRLKQKQINISKVVLAIGGWEPPEVVGLCEVENFRVLYGLTNFTPLIHFGYRIIHFDSPDPRGIDVALLYRPDKFRVFYSKPIAIRFPFDTVSRTRDILFVKGIASKHDTVNIFVNHWPSKFGGALVTIPKRNYVASVLRRLTDSLLAVNPGANILIMGDLNESPYEEAVSKVLRAKMDSVNLEPDDLYDLLAGAGLSWERGTIKFHEEWETIDHMIASKPMLLHTTPHGLKIFDAPFLLQDDEAWFGKKPFRTYYGIKYIGGFSDHLPVYTDFKF